MLIVTHQWVRLEQPGMRNTPLRAGVRQQPMLKVELTLRAQHLCTEINTQW